MAPAPGGFGESIGGGSSTAVVSNPLVPAQAPQAPPANLTKPSIPATGTTGEAIACDPGTWSGSPTAFDYTWLRDGNPIAGAGARSYTLTAGDAGHAIRCRVVARNAGGASPAELSNALAAAAPPPPAPEPPANLEPPSIPASAQTGDALHCSAGRWSGEPVLGYQWLRDGAVIASGPDYTVTAGDVGHALRCKVTATNDGGSASAESAALTPTAVPTPTPTPTPTPPRSGPPKHHHGPKIHGKALKGRTVKCRPGAWTDNPSLAYQWLRNTAPISGATRPAYRVQSRDVGRALACRVIASNPGGTATATSPAVRARHLRDARSRGRRRPAARRASCACGGALR